MSKTHEIKVTKRELSVRVRAAACVTLV